MAISSFTDKESICNLEFTKALDLYGSLWHYCTPGNLNASINLTMEDYQFSVNNYALSAAESGVAIITDAHMANHTHGLLGGSLEKVSQFENCYLYRENKYLKSIDRDVDLSQFRCDNPIPITDLNMMRNEIVYINRNGYVADSKYTPYSYPWSGGYIYFNHAAQIPRGESFLSINYREKRAVSYRSIISVPQKYRFEKGLILQSSYLEYQLGQAMFRDAHHYFSMLTKNAEAYSESAKRLGDTIILTDEELFNVVCMITKRDHNMVKPQMLPPEAKIATAKILKANYNATNSQIQRILKLPIETVNELFPLYAKR